MQSTTDPKLSSFVDYDEKSHFPIQNLPFGIFEEEGKTRAGVRIGDMVLDLALLEKEVFSPPCRSSSIPALLIHFWQWDVRPGVKCELSLPAC